MPEWPDAVNGLFEILGGAFICLSIRKTLRDKMVRGVSWLHVMFFLVWGVWNLYFYPWAGAWVSFAGGIVIAVANVVWVSLLIYYSVQESNQGDMT